MPNLILASTSSARRAMMNSLKLPYRAVRPGVDEVVPATLPVEQMVQVLALRKARAVLAAHPDAWVIGADQLVSVDGAPFGKPETRDQARGQLSKLLGRTHEVVTGVCLISTATERVEVDVVRMTAYPLTADELERYLDLGEWQGCAGSYRVEEAGAALFQQIEGDRTSVQGLPLLRLVRLLREAGFTFFT